MKIWWNDKWDFNVKCMKWKEWQRNCFVYWQMSAYESIWIWHWEKWKGWQKKLFWAHTKHMKAYECDIVRISAYKNIWKCDVQCEMSHMKLWKHTSMDCEISTYGIIWKYIYMIWRHMKRNNIFENVYICLKYLWIVKVHKLQMNKNLLWSLCGLVYFQNYL